MANANLFALFASRFPEDLQQIAIETHDGLQYSWQDVLHASARMAHLLVSLKLPAGARIAVQVDKSVEALLIYLATLRAGYVYLPLNTAYQQAELTYFLEDAAPSVLICRPQHFGWISKLGFKAGVSHVFTLSDQRSGTWLDRAVVHADDFDTVLRQPHDLAAILYTSGTTGRSKGAMLTHGNLSSNALVLHQYWAWRDGRAAKDDTQRDVLLHALPLFHIHGLFVACHGALLSASKMIFLPKFDTAQVCHYLPRSTVFMGVPTYYTRLLSDPVFNQCLCNGMRLFVSGSAPLLAETFQTFQARTHHTILERYGMSETGMLCSNPYDETDSKRRAGRVGLPLPGVAVRIVDAEGKPCAVNQIGSIEVKGPNVFAGYWRMPEKTQDEMTADGYFKTGDLGQFNQQGYLTIVGRAKDLIISGGYNVYPKEVESYLDALPTVEESAVFGVAHPDLGEAVFAVVVLKEDLASTVDKDTRPFEATMIAKLKQQIAGYKIPKRIAFVSSLPRNTMGKVQKNLLRQQYSSAT